LSSDEAEVASDKLCSENSSSEGQSDADDDQKRDGRGRGRRQGVRGRGRGGRGREKVVKDEEGKEVDEDLAEVNMGAEMIQNLE